jgi:hypothetical protein
MNQFVTIPAYGIPANYAFTDAKDAIIPYKVNCVQLSAFLE